MSGFHSEGHVLLSDVEQFHGSVDHFLSALHGAGTEIPNEVKDLIDEVAEKANELHKLSAECDELYEQIQKKKHSIEQHVASLKRQLASTPKTIEKTVTNSDGSTKTVKEPNPEYQRITAELQHEQSRLSKIKELSWKVYNKKSELQRQTQYLQSLLGTMEAAAKKVIAALGSLSRKAERAARCLDQTEEAVREYVSVSWR